MFTTVHGLRRVLHFESQPLFLFSFVCEYLVVDFLSINIMNSDSTSASSPPLDQSSNLFATTIDHPRFKKIDATSIRAFIRFYDQYVKEVQGSAQQLLSKKLLTHEVATSLHLRLCVDAEWIKLLIALGLRKTMRPMMSLPILVFGNI